MANAMLAAMQGIGLHDVKTVGDSTAALDLNAVQENTAAAE
jgi:hypothetical protein